MAIQQKHIFVVDDNEMMVEMLADHLRKNPGYTVTTFSTGEECINNLTLNPDVIILDYQLNNLVPNAEDGNEILQQIKKLDKTVKIIMLSSQDDYGKALQTVMNGANEYVVKNADAFERIDAVLAD
jgi:two-component system OmpR family response regulator